MTANAADTARTVTVTIISIWSKLEGLEGRLSGRSENVVYTVDVPAEGSDTDIMERAFMRTNSDDRPMGRRACSTTAGDLMVVDGRHYLVESTGFSALREDQAKAAQALFSSATSLGFNYLVSTGRLPA